MGALFDATSSIVDLEPKAKPLFYARGNQWLLWPALAYRVYAPQPSPERFNLFQRSVLSLCRAGVVRADEIGHMLALGTDLAGYVLGELVGMGLLDRRGELSERARRLLDDEPDDRIEPVAGYVFADPVSGALWPRFHQGALPYADGEIRGLSGTFQWGSVGDPRTIYARVVWPPRGEHLMVPSARDIMRACSASIRATTAYARSLGKEQGLDASGFGAGTLRRHLNQVILVDDTPEPIFMTTFVFVPKDVRRATHWQVCDPFGLGPSYSLRRRIDELVATKDGDALRQIIEKVTGEGFAVEDADVLELLRLQGDDAAKLVAENIRFDPRLCPAAWERLVQMERSHIQAGSVKDASGAAWDIQQKALGEMARRAYEAIEEVFSSAVQTFPMSDIWLPLSGSLEDNGVLLAAIARESGFADDPVLPCFEELLFIGGGPVKGVVLHNNRELIALVAAALLSSRERPEHPLSRCAEEFPELIVFLHRLKQLRDQSSHDTEGGLDTKATFRIPSEVYRVARLMLPTSNSGAGSSSADTGKSASPSTSAEWSADLVYRLRAQAARLVETDDLFGLRVRELPPLRDALVDMEHVALELAMLRAAGATAEEMTGRIKDLRFACVNAVEASLKPLLTAADVLELISDDRSGNATRYSEAAHGLGFATAENGRYHEDLLMVRPDRARSAATTKNGALNALLMVATLQAEQDTDHPLRAVAATNPRFLVLAGAISHARGHDGEAPGAETIDPENLHSYVVAIGRAVLEAVT